MTEKWLMSCIRGNASCAVMSDVFVKVKIQVVDGGRYVREFKKEYGNRIEDARMLKTDGGVLDAWLGWRGLGIVRKRRLMGLGIV